MRKKNKNNNENAQMQDMNTVQMDGANAAFAANVNFSGAILQERSLTFQGSIPQT